ncbi:arylesterase [Tsuneonella deserti]|uniref:Arylesterase n=1 Tax=Tsuneonella deserti TaxID=2035528 RepID=A0ABQ1S433_9SPHN|nr:arylesterase [Tsuneonella deserti]GGD90280.1 arylesterase [Tsuneonella deserti]
MRIVQWVAIGSLALVAGCDSAAPPPAAGPSAETIASAAPVQGPQIDVLAVGDSLFAGYGLASPAQSYPARLEQALRQEGLNVRIVNAGVSGDTTAAGRQRLAFTLDSQPVKPDLVLLELGGNDLLRGLPPEQTRANLDAMLSELDKRTIPVALMGLQAPPNYGAKWQAQYDAIFPELARKHGAALVPFVTAKVFADARMLQADRIHPTAQGVEELVRATSASVRDALPEGE